MTTIYNPLLETLCPIPFFISGIPAGFASPAEDYIEKQLDLNDLVVKHPHATFYVRVDGDSMRDAGIQSGDILVVDRSLEPSHGKIVVALLDGEFTVKRINMGSNQLTLLPANSAYAPISISEASDFQVWGVVTYVIHRAS